jgi:hypothetical protein
LTNRKSVNQFDRKQIEEEIDRFSMVPFSSLKKGNSGQHVYFGPARDSHPALLRRPV